jgi:hypothetical protein
LTSKTTTQREHLTFAAKLEIGVRSQESGARRKEEEGRRKKEGGRRSVFTNMRCSPLNSSKKAHLSHAVESRSANSNFSGSTLICGDLSRELS